MTWSGRELLDCFEPYPGASLTADGTVRIVTTAEAPASGVPGRSAASDREIPDRRNGRLRRRERGAFSARGLVGADRPGASC